MVDIYLKAPGTKRKIRETRGRLYQRIIARKRPRYLTSWEESFRRMPCSKGTFHSKNDSCDSTKQHWFGLVDLFGGNRWACPLGEASSFEKNTIHNTNFAIGKSKRAGQPSNNGGHPSPKTNMPSKFFTLRMEHRQGGAAAKHVGEERFLLFRSDQAGAIAKVVFSSSPVTIGDSEDASTKMPKAQTCKNPDEEIFTMANAKIHVLYVKDTYRGFNLGGFLFVLCTTYLRERYCNSFNPQLSNRPILRGISSVRCLLDAEEDVRRHDKLVQFYEHLGLRRRTRAKTVFINNNDGETYRKIPMKIDLRVKNREIERPKRKINHGDHHFAAEYSSFLPAVLKSSSGESARLNDKRIDSWLIMESGGGNIQLRTTDGRKLGMDQWGNCRLVPVHEGSSGCSTNTGFDSFKLLRVSDMLDKVLYDKEEEYEEERFCLRDKLLREHHHQQKYHWLAKKKELWMIRSSVFGTFMRLTQSNDLFFSEEASFWQADDNFCLTHTYDSPARRQHHRRMWMKQSVDYVTHMRHRYSEFNLQRMTIEEALNITKNLQANPFSISMRREQKDFIERLNTPSPPSFRTYLFHTAELARREGHPDWVQFVALIHGLASALTCVRSSSGSIFQSEDSVTHDDQDDFDWTIYVDTRIMGCKASKYSTFAEFRHLNPDKGDTRYSTRTGLYQEHIGLERVLLSWTGSDYMYWMLKHNGVKLPREAYAILKLFPLVDWHSRGEYTALSNDDDEELKPFVADFYDLRYRSHISVLSNPAVEEMGDEECRALWANHYSLIANKYGAGSMLRW